MPSNIFEIYPMGGTIYGDYRDAFKEDNYGNPDSVEFEFLVDYRTNPNINPGHWSNWPSGVKGF